MTSLDWSQLSLLVYLETCVVDYRGRVDSRRMTHEDWEVMEVWKEEGFVRFGRIAAADHNYQGNMWVELSEGAWKEAHAERIARFARRPHNYKRIES